MKSETKEQLEKICAANVAVVDQLRQEANQVAQAVESALQTVIQGGSRGKKALGQMKQYRMMLAGQANQALMMVTGIMHQSVGAENTQKDDHDAWEAGELLTGNMSDVAARAGDVFQFIQEAMKNLARAFEACQNLYDREDSAAAAEAQVS